jgi:hypothetical protein
MMPVANFHVVVRARFVWYARLILKIVSIPARVPGCRALVIPITHLAWMQVRIDKWTGWRWVQVRVEDERKVSAPR